CSSKMGSRWSWEWSHHSVHRIHHAPREEFALVPTLCVGTNAPTLRVVLTAAHSTSAIICRVAAYRLRLCPATRRARPGVTCLHLSVIRIEFRPQQQQRGNAADH